MTYHRKILSILLGLTLALMSNFAHAQYNPDEYDQAGKDMLERCRSQGAISVMNELLQDKQQGWEEVVEKTATGNMQWIWASICLSHGLYYNSHDRTDYAWATLMDAWAQALLKNPRELLSHSLEISHAMICTLPLDFRGKTVEFADDFLAKALSAVETVEEDYQISKEMCKLHLKLSHERFINFLKEYEKGH